LPLEIRFGTILRLEGEDGEAVESIMRMVTSEFAQQRIGYKMIVHMGVCQILTLLSRKYIEITEHNIAGNSMLAVNYPNIVRVKGFIEHHYNEDITKDQLAKIGMCSVRQLSRKFKELTGDTVVEYVLRLRLNHVKKMLTASDEKVTEIAFESGFKDISYFNKVFRANVNLTPKEYRDQYNQQKI
jgi:transcriptional regulator GlxA family with amidase domain